VAARAVLVVALCGAVAQAEDGRRIDLNTASATELAELPGIGPAKAEAIIEYRQKTPFASPDELRNVKGIGEHLFESLRDRVSASGKVASGTPHEPSHAGGGAPASGQRRASGGSSGGNHNATEASR